MKKVLVAGTALMLAGSVVAQAQAEVNISGDARVTYVGKQDYQRTATDKNGYDDYFESRIGLNFDGTAPTKGVGVKARVYFDGAGFQDPAIWNGETPTQDISVDYAYLTAPLGDAWTIKAGRINLDYSKFFSWNIRPTRVIASYAQGGVTLSPFIGVKQEASTELDAWNDNDFMEYGLVAGLKLENGWQLKAYGRYDDDQRQWDQAALAEMEIPAGALGNPSAFTVALPSGFSVPLKGQVASHTDRSGFLGDVFLDNAGANCDFGFHAEFAYKAADVQGTTDDGMGGYVQLSKQINRFTPAVLAGMTKDGYMADSDFGFVMVGGNDFASAVPQVGNGGSLADDPAKGGDLLFGAFVANYAFSDRLSLTGNFLYADYDNDKDGKIDSAIEISGVATYALNDSASVTYQAGWLKPTVNGGGVAEDAYFGHLLRLNIAF